MLSPVLKMLDLSTAHISADTCNALCSAAAPIIAYEKGEYGVFVHVQHTHFIGGDDDPAMPNDLMDCIQYARERDCTWIMFDRDALKISTLPIYNW